MVLVYNWYELNKIIKWFYDVVLISQNILGLRIWIDFVIHFWYIRLQYSFELNHNYLFFSNQPKIRKVFYLFMFIQVFFCLF